MRGFVLGLIASVVLLMPTVGTAQVYDVRSSSPEINAASADWQVNSELMPLAGLVYAPAHETRMFDPQVMVQIGVYQGVPVFADATQEVWSIVYVPIGRGNMRTYNRVHANTTGVTGLQMVDDTPKIPTVAPDLPRASAAPVAVADTRWHPTHIESIPTPHAAGGVWLEFRGQRWYSDGVAVPYASDRFAFVGEYHGFPVYRDRSGRRDRIWVAVVHDGPLAPYVIR
jgi:hypothetical protein